MRICGWMTAGLIAWITVAAASAQVGAGTYGVHTLDNDLRIESETRLADSTRLQLQALNAQLRHPGRVGVVLSEELVDFPELGEVRALFDLPTDGRPLQQTARCPDGSKLHVQHTWDRLPERVTAQTLWIHHVLRFEGRPVEHQFVHAAGGDLWRTVGESRCSARSCTLPAVAELARMYCAQFAADH